MTEVTPPPPPAQQAISGEPMTVKECRRCKKKDATGISWVRDPDQALLFKCDSCGKKMYLGKTKDASDRNMARIKQMDDFDTARSKAVREDDAIAKELEKEELQKQGGEIEQRKRDELEVSGSGFFWANYMGVPGAPRDY